MKVLFISEGPNGCGLYRAEIPIRYLPGVGIDARLSHVNALDHELEWADVLVVQKQYERHFYQKVLNYKRAGKKIVYEIDDDVFNIPPWNPAHIHFHRIKGNIIQYLRLADAVTVSTPYLKNQISKYNRNVHVCPNSIDFEELDREGPAPDQISALDKRCARLTLDDYRDRLQGRFVIGWLGSPTHKRDLQVVTPALKVICDRYGDRVVVVMGGCASKDLIRITPYDQMVFLEMVPPRIYLRYLASIGLSVGLAPVYNHVFNYSKSNLKVLEYMASGYVPIASDLVTYNTTVRNGHTGFLCNTPGSWVSAISKLIEKPALLQTLRQNGDDYVRENFDIKKTVLKWASVFKTL